MSCRWPTVAGLALRLLLAAAVLHNGIALATAAEPEVMAHDATSMAHHGHHGASDGGSSGDSGPGGMPDCCDDPGCTCGCTAPQACLLPLVHSCAAAAHQAEASPFRDRQPPLARNTAPFRPPA